MITMRTVACALVLVGLGSNPPRRATPSATDEIESFNRRFLELILKTDHGGMMAEWAEDGVDLMPDEAPIIGKKAIEAWLDGIEKSMPGSRVSKQEMAFHDIEVSGDWASEWATEHQIVERTGKPPTEGYGKIALVLHREKNGGWKIKQEMWNNMPRP